VRDDGGSLRREAPEKLRQSVVAACRRVNLLHVQLDLVRVHGRGRVPGRTRLGPQHDVLTAGRFED
jgi:hypothetical protein